ncbi:DUF2461 domain-containing protein [Neisseria sp. Ec49-e6-T10]|uniref:DUF2461 domain-containing protein n=1 Tax=Neisseria sp. Ec49-e6-T10 TaxID=3140744 RepID=UPI003EBA716F
MTQNFQGFSAQALDFLQEVRIQNSREWFAENRQTYDALLLTPFRLLVTELSQTMMFIDPEFETRPAIGKTLSRLNRDTRYTHDKSLYRSHMWLTFKRRSPDWKDAPVYFFEIAPDFYRYGLGYYCASRATMDVLRQLIQKDTKAFLTVVRKSTQTPFELVGECYKRPLVKEQDPEIANWYNRKSFALMYESPKVEDVSTVKIVKQLEKGFTQLAPLYEYLMKAEQLKRSQASHGM